MKNKKRIEALEEQVRILMSCSGNVSKTESQLTELPEKWCIKSAEAELLDYVNKNGVNAGTYTTDELSMHYAHFPPYKTGTTHVEILQGYTKITFDQFKKCVLKEDEKKEALDQARKDTNNAIEEAIKNIERPSIREVQVKVSSQEEANECAEIAKACGEVVSKNMNYEPHFRNYFSYNYTGANHFGFYSKDGSQTEISFQEYKERFGKSKEIDWSKAGQLVESDDYIVAIQKDLNQNDLFSGIILKFKHASVFSDFESAKFSKSYFKLCTEPIILKNE